MAKDTVEILIEGGSATPGPPLGPALGPFGINMMQVVEEINEKSADFKGMKVPVIVTIDSDTKDFEIAIGTPPTTALIMDELNIEKGSHESGTEVAADLSVEQALKIARMKYDSLLANNYKHGGYGTRLYHIWCGMKKRCYDCTDKDYKNYGERGIRICNEW